MSGALEGANVTFLALPCPDPMSWPQAAVWIAVLLMVTVVGYAFCRYVLGDG